MFYPRLYPQIGQCNLETHEYLRSQVNEFEAMYWFDVLGIDNSLPFGICVDKNGKRIKMFKRWVYWKVKILKLFKK